MAGTIHRKKFLQLATLAPLSIPSRPLSFLAEAVPPFTNENVMYITAKDAAYDVLRHGFNKRIDKKPAIIALCKNTAGVSAAIQYAAAHDLPVAVKSGGHCMEGFSCNNGGMVINLSSMNGIHWIDEETVQLEPGCRLSEIYDALLPKKKIIPGGSCAGVGIGGLVLGGGYGLLARKFGLTCDSLAAVTMVDGMGKVLTASGNDDLLWACKGGNNGNFGVVTSLTFKVHPAPATMQSHRFKAYRVNAARAGDILKTWFEQTGNLPVDCFSAFVLNGKTLYILLTNTGRETTAVKKCIAALQAATDKTTHSVAQPLARALKNYYGRTNPMNFKNASAGLYKNFEEIESFIGEALQIVVNTPGMIYQVNTLGGNIQQSEFEKAAAFPHRASYFFSELQTYWESSQQEKHLLQRFETVQHIFAVNGIRAQYRNYPDINFSNWSTGYYGNNYERLQQVKSTYDPHNLFRYEQSIEPA